VRRRLDRTPRGSAGIAALVLLAAAVAGCSGDDSPPRDTVRARIAALAPAANLGHRGTGLTRSGHPFPENSLPSFRAAMDQGADGIELDVELTSDGFLLVMHDDTLDRTTTCEGCLSAYTLAEARECRLLSGDGVPTAERPPTLEEVFDVLPRTALVNVELKVYGGTCRTPTTGPETLAATAAAEVLALGVESRVLFSSFDEEAMAAIRAEPAGFYAALLLGVQESIDWPDALALARSLDQDAVHPFFIIPPEGVAAVRAEGLQANVWTVNLARDMEAAIDAGVTAIITDEPAILTEVLRQRGRG